MTEEFPSALREEVATGPDEQQEQRSAAPPRRSPPDSPPDSPSRRPAGRPANNARNPGSGNARGGAQSRPSQHKPAFAAIDLGTNNCRLLIARPAGEHFVVIDAFSRVVRLGEGLAQTGRLSQAAMDRALGALQVCADKLMRRNVHLARSVATEACRRATNGCEFIDRVKAETGIVLDIISAGEEARLAVLGCHLLLEAGDGPAMIFDIGGGSTELVLVEAEGGQVPRIRDWQSVPWGVVSLTETCGHEPDDEVGRAARYEHMRKLVRDSLAPFAERIAETLEQHNDHPSLRLLGTSGTVTTLASVHLDLPQYDRRAVDGLIVPAQSMRGISAGLAAMTPAQRRAQPCIGRERSDLVVAGCAILETILDLWPADRLGVADRGIREGILRGLMSAEGAGERTRAALRRMKREASV